MSFLAGCLIQRSGWTSSADVFSRWLSSIHFEGGGFGEAAIAEGLAEALIVSIILTKSGPQITHIKVLG